jgi:nitroreductase
MGSGKTESAMHFGDVIEARHSVRRFRRRTVRAEELRTILAAAQLAPSAGNLQAYSIVVVTGQATTQALVRAAFDQDFLADAAAVLVFLAEPGRTEGTYGARGVALYCVQDATIAAAYAQLAATDLGLASCWVGAFRDAEVARVVGAAPPLRPVAMLAIGHAGESPQHPPRRRLEEFVHDGLYGQAWQLP